MAFFANLPNDVYEEVNEPRYSATNAREEVVVFENEKENVQEEERDVHTVAFIMSDGDNLQILQNDFVTERFFNSPERGHLPVSWSYAPCMAVSGVRVCDLSVLSTTPTTTPPRSSPVAATTAFPQVLMPNALEWARSQLTANDTLSAGPSGIGYAFPQLFPQGVDQAHAQATSLLMRASGQSLVNVIGVVPSRESLSQLVVQDAIKSVVYFTFGPASMGYSALHGNVDMQQGVPVVAPRLNLWGEDASGDEVGVQGLVDELSTMPKNANLTSGYSIVVVTPSHNYSDVVRAGEMLMEQGGFEVSEPWQANVCVGTAASSSNNS
mmetsp:Transcript_11659/g.20426  ORF Transcript_11659/g.20426 Transcript_11659/m.20426 type:complete len:324 (-) Transcript_11659:456-1427(-)